MKPPFPVVVLAAGSSSRMGAPKALHAYRGQPWIRWQLGQLEAAGIRQAVVATSRAHADACREAAKDVGLALSWVVNPQPERGPFSSLQLALPELGGGPAFVLPVDVPVAEPGVWRALEAALGPGIQAALPQREGHGGHPVLCSQALLDRCRRLSLTDPEARLDALIHALPAEQVARVPTQDAAVSLNLNTPEDWERFRA
jgi:molybdenum cofactor cytidylyltransferase